MAAKAARGRKAAPLPYGRPELLMRVTRLSVETMAIVPAMRARAM
jgi:hypothetical protein